jgi:hypothetical protein
LSMMMKHSQKMTTPINAKTMEPIKAPGFNHSTMIGFLQKNKLRAVA